MLKQKLGRDWLFLACHHVMKLLLASAVRTGVGTLFESGAKIILFLDWQAK